MFHSLLSNVCHTLSEFYFRMKFTVYVIIFLPVPIFCYFEGKKKTEKFEPEYAVPEDKPNKCAADQKTSDTGVYADIQVEENDNPLLHVSDDKTVTFSQPLLEKTDRSPDIDFSDPTRHDQSKFNEQDFKEKM